MKKIEKPGLLKSALQRIFPWTLTRPPDLPSDAGDGFGWNADNPLRGRGMNADTVMSLSAAWACVTLLCDTISTLPISVYERTEDGRRLANDHPLAFILRQQPSEGVTPTQFLSPFLASMLLRDGGFAEKLVLGTRLVGLRFLNRDRLSCQKRSSGEGVEWWYTADGKRRQIPEDRLWRVPGFTLDGVNGCSAICYGASVFSSAIAADTAARNTFWRGLLSTIYFKFPRILKEHQREQMRETIATISGAVNAGKPAILEADMDAGELGINPHDAQLLESRAYSVEEICSWFRVQPFMIGRASQGQTNWGTGIEQQMIGFVTFTLGPWLARLEQAMNALLPPADRLRYFVKFNVAALLRGDSTARAALYSSALQNGWMNRNEVRALEDSAPIEGGDLYTVQSALIALGAVGAQPAPADAAKALLLNWLRPEDSEQ